MLGINKYFLFSSNSTLLLSRDFSNWIKFFRISSFIRIVFFTDSYFSLKFFGVCVNKSSKGLGSTFELFDRLGVRQRFYLFSPVLKSVVVIQF